MKPVFVKTALLIIFLLSAPAFGLAQQETRTKNISRQFKVNSDVKLKVESSFGKVNCTVWDKNEISVDVEIRVDTRSENEARRILDQINPVITGSASLVEIKTETGSISSGNKSTSFSVDYTIRMPESTRLDIESRFGSLYTDATTAPARLAVEYGSLTLKKFTNPDYEIILKFSTGKIESLGKGRLDLQYSTINLGTADFIDMDSKFSTISTKTTTGIRIDSQYDNLSIEKISGLEGSAKFTAIKIDALINRLELSLQYGGLDVSSVHPSFSNISLDASFNSINLGIDPAASYRLNADMSFGECRYPKKAAISVTGKSMTSSLYSGTVGTDKNPSARVTIKGRNSDVKLY